MLDCMEVIPDMVPFVMEIEEPIVIDEVFNDRSPDNVPPDKIEVPSVKLVAFKRAYTTLFDAASRILPSALSEAPVRF